MSVTYYPKQSRHNITRLNRNLETASHPLYFTSVAALPFVRVCQLLKQAAILFTLVALVAMAYLPKTLYGATGLSDNFRYALLIEVALIVAGVSCQLAVWTVLLKWTLAGQMSVGVVVWRSRNAFSGEDSP